MSGKNKAVLVLTPLVILVICGGIIAGMAYRPFRKLEKISGIVFSAEADHGEISEIVYSEKEVEEELDDGNTIIYPSFGAQYATIKIDSIGLEAPVYFGSSEELLKLGVCQYIGSVVIGEVGNVVLDAHCNTFFYDLENVKAGDLITLTTSYGEFTYKATESVLFKETNHEYISAMDTDRLTLYTCYGNLLGPTEDRLAVLCELVEKNFYN